MELTIALVYVDRGARSYLGWAPGWALHSTALTLAELRDEVAIAVMERVERMSARELAAMQLAPHVEHRHVKVDVSARNRHSREEHHLVGRLGVLLEKWPGDDYLVATPTRAPQLRFTLPAGSDLEDALMQRLRCEAVEGRLSDLSGSSASHPEQFEILPVDVYPPTVLPSRPRAVHKRDGRRARSATHAERADRNRMRLSARTLRAVCANLTHPARDGALPPAHGQGDLVTSLLSAMRAERAAVVLIGASGSGKTAVVFAAIRQLVAEESAAGRRDVWRINGNRFIAGMSYVGQWEERAQALTRELSEIGDILYADDLLALAFAGRTRDEDTNLVQYLEPNLRRGRFVMIAESTEERFARLREEAPGFAALFRPIHVASLEAEAALPVLLGAVRSIERDALAAGRQLDVRPEAMTAIVSVCERFYPEQAFPGKAVRLLKEVVGRAEASVLDAESVVAAFQKLSGLPKFVVLPQERRPESEIRRFFSGRVAGQPEIVDAFVDLLLVVQQGLEDPDKPLASFLLVGPSGVGKTESAKALASYLFGSESRLVRFDMSELSSPASIDRFVGMVGGHEGELVRAVRQRPFCVVLLDEIEKAHPLVFDSLLQLLGEGRLTDASGHTASARKCVVLMTSNLGVQEAASRVGFLQGSQESQDRHYHSAARSFFRPELYNRIDRIVPFRLLDEDAMVRVVQRGLDGLLARRGLRQGRLLVDVDPALVSHLVEEGADPRYGARPLRQALEKRVTVPLARRLVNRKPDQWTLVCLYPGGDNAPDRDAPRRRAETTARSSLDSELRAGAELELSLHTLAPIEAFSEHNLPDPEPHPDRLLAIHGRLCDRVEALVSEVRDSPPLRLELDLLSDRLKSIQTHELEPLQLVEDVQFELRGYAAGMGRNINSKHNRPTELVMEQPVVVDRQTVARKLGPLLTAASDELEVLAHRAAAPSHETWTLVLHFHTQRRDVMVVEHLLAVLPLAAATRLFWGNEELTQAEVSSALQGEARESLRLVFEGPAWRQLLSPLCGLVLATNVPFPGDASLAEVLAYRGDAEQAAAFTDGIKSEESSLRSSPGSLYGASGWQLEHDTVIRRQCIVWILDGASAPPVHHLGWGGAAPSEMRQLIAAWLRELRSLNGRKGSTRDRDDRDRQGQGPEE